jgi:hypothetical protein
MIAKSFEVRDSMTSIPVLAVKLDPGNDRDKYLLNRSGFHKNSAEYVILWRLEGGHCTYDPVDWNTLTMRVAHGYIIASFDGLESGSVVDVEHIRGLRSEPRTSWELE